MSAAKNKTQKTQKSVRAYLKTISPQQKQDDCFTLLALMAETSGLEPKLWGKIVGFGDYHYKYESGREGDLFRAGFAARAQSLVIYIIPGYSDFTEELSRLGKHTIGKSCLYIKRLSDIDETVLREIIAKGLKIMETKYPS